MWRLQLIGCSQPAASSDCQRFLFASDREVDRSAKASAPLLSTDCLNLVNSQRVAVSSALLRCLPAKIKQCEPGRAWLLEWAGLQSHQGLPGNVRCVRWRFYLWKHPCHKYRNPRLKSNYNTFICRPALSADKWFWWAWLLWASWRLNEKKNTAPRDIYYETVHTSFMF